MSVELSKNCIQRLLSASIDESLWTEGHVIQLLSLKRIANPREPSGMQDRYRLIISDGSHYTQAMLATQLNHFVEKQTIKKNTVVKVTQLTSNNVQGKRLLILLNLQIVADCDKIGEPEQFDIPRQGGEGGITSTVPSTVGSTATVTATEPQKLKPEIAQVKPPPQLKKSNGPIVIPIEGLTPYGSATIKVRVTQKSDIRTYSNARGEGKFFNVHLMDDSGEIRATVWNFAVDNFYDKLEVGKVYYVSKARVGVAKKKFSALSNEYELTFEGSTEIEECPDQINAPQVKYNFVQLSDIGTLQKDAMCDVIGIVKDIGDVSEITSRNFGKQVTKRDITLVDRSDFSMRLTIWGKQAETFNAEAHAVVAFKNVKVGDFGGRTLSMVSSSIMAVNPDISESHILRGWFDAEGTDHSFKSYSNAMVGSSSSGTFNRDEVCTIKEVQERGYGQQDKPDYFSCRATVMHFKAENLYYPACKNDGCNKKVIETEESWRCEKCNQSWSSPEYRYILSISVADYTGQIWMQGFNDVGNIVFGMSANDLHELKGNEAEYNAVLAKANCNTYTFSCRAKKDTYNDILRVRYGITRIFPLDYKAEASALRNALKSSWAQ